MEDTFDVFLINKEGEKISSPAISWHIGLSNKLIQDDEELKKKFELSKKNSALEFLLGDEGYMAGSEIGNYYKQLTYESNLASEKQKRLIQYYSENGYGLKDLAKEKEKMERGEIWNGRKKRLLWSFRC